MSDMEVLAEPCFCESSLSSVSTRRCSQCASRTMDDAQVAHKAPLEITSIMTHFLNFDMFFGSSRGSKATSYGSVARSSFTGALGTSVSASSAAVYSDTTHSELNG